MMSPKLSEDTLASYRDVFSLFDKDSSGAISSSELATVMRSFGQQPSKAEIDYIMHRVDIDKNGTIDFDEFLILMSRPELSPVAQAKPLADDKGVTTSPRSPEEEEDAELWEAFRVFDKDGSGKISFDELSKVMDNLGETLSQEELQQMIDEGDLDGDQEISFQEFKNMMTGR